MHFEFQLFGLPLLCSDYNDLNSKLALLCYMKLVQIESFTIKIGVLYGELAKILYNY